MSRLMGLDYGKKTVGVALSDDNITMAIPYTTIRRERESKLRRTIADIRNIINEKKITKIILGNPINMDGSNSDSSFKVANFKNLLEEKLNVEVILVDERLTSFEADILMQELGYNREKRSKYSDEIAAKIILEDYINNKQGLKYE